MTQKHHERIKKDDDKHSESNDFCFCSESRKTTRPRCFWTRSNQEWWENIVLGTFNLYLGL